MTQRRAIFNDEAPLKRPLAQLPSFSEHENDLDNDLAEAETEEYGEESEATSAAGLEKEETFENLSVDEIIERTKKYEDWDIFEDVGPALVLKGDTVKYSIKKNGKHLYTVDHPFSYDEIQKNSGGGSYVVTLRSKLFSKRPGGGYLCSQPRIVATLEEAGRIPAPSAEPKASPTEMLTILQQMNDKARAEQQAEMSRLREENRLREERLERESKAREERLERETKEREAKRESEGASTLTLLMKMMEQNSASQREAAQRQSEMMIAMLTKQPPVEKEDKKNDKLFDMMLSVLLDKKGKGESLDVLTLQKLLSEAHDKGYSQASEIRELAREEAALLVSRGGSNDDDDEQEPKEEESTTKMLLKTLTPMLAQLAQPAPQPAQPAPQRMISQQPPRRPALPPQATNVNPNALAKAPTFAQPVRQAPQMIQAPKSPLAGLPRAIPATQPVTQAVSKGPTVPQAPKVVSKKEIVSEVVINLIGADLSANIFTGKFDPEGAADKALVALKDRQVDAAWLVTNFTLEDMKAVAKAKGVPDTVHPYLERFHKHIGTLASHKSNLVAPTNPS